MTTAGWIILIIIALAIGIGISLFFVLRLNKKKVNDLIDIGNSEANDSDREDLIEKAKEQIERNKKVIKNAKEALNNSSD